MAELITHKRIIYTILILIGVVSVLIITAKTPTLIGREVKDASTAKVEIEPIESTEDYLTSSRVDSDKNIDNTSTQLRNESTEHSTNSAQSTLNLSINSQVSTSEDFTDMLDSNSDTESKSKTKININGHDITVNEGDRIRETIKDQDSRIKLRVSDGNDGVGSSSLKISIDSETNESKED